MSVSVLRVSPGLHSLRFLQDLDPDHRRASINQTDALGDAALHVAASKGLRLVVDYLIKNNADLNLKNKAGSTPLHKAVASGSSDVVKCLLDKCDWVPNLSGLTPFSYAFEIAKNDVELFKVLLSKETSNPFTSTMTVPGDMLSYIIGKQSQTLSKIRGEHLTLIELPPKNFDKEAQPNNSDKVLTLIGRNQEDIESCKQTIESLIKRKIENDAKKLKEEKEKNSNKPPSKTDSKVDPQPKEKTEFKLYSRQIPFKDQKLISKLLQEHKYENVPKKVESQTKNQQGKNQSDKNQAKEKKTTTKDFIEEKTKTQIVLPKRGSNDPITVYGEPNDVKAAIQQIIALKPVQADLPEKTIYVAKSKHRYIIGKKGANINYLKEKYGVTVIVPPSSSTEEDIILRGAPQDIESVRVEIVGILKSIPDIPEYTPPAFNEHQGAPSGEPHQREFDEQPRGGRRGGRGRGRGGGRGGRRDQFQSAEGFWNYGDSAQDSNHQPAAVVKRQPKKINLNDDTEFPAFPSFT